MPNYRRNFTYGGIYFFTVVLENRKLKLLYKYIQEFRQAYAETLSFYSFKTIAICILPDHFHFIIQLPENEKNYSKIINSIKYNFSIRLPEKYRNPNQSKLDKCETGIWQRRYWEHLIRDELDLERHINYIYFNPVKHKYVKRVRDWEYSSFHRDVKQGFYSIDWGNMVDDLSIRLYDD